MLEASEKGRHCSNRQLPLVWPSGEILKKTKIMTTRQSKQGGFYILHTILGLIMILFYRNSGKVSKLENWHNYAMSEKYEN